MKSTLLITGGSGLLALNWAAAMHNSWDVVLGLHNKIISPSFARTRVVDLSNADTLAKSLDEIAPSLVVHTASMTNVEACEADPALAKRTNVDILQVLAAQCLSRDIQLIVISTDHLFSGSQKLVGEETSFSPLNVYAQTKADGEKAALDTNPRALVARTNFFGWGPSYRRSFSDQIIDALRANQPIQLFTDVHFTPIFAAQLARDAHALVAKKANGVYNLVGDERLSKHAFGLKIANHFGLDITLIHKSLFSRRTDLTPRPLEMGLDNSKARAKLNKSLGGVQTYLQKLAACEGNPIIHELRQL